MSATILIFPNSGRSAPRIESIADLPRGTKAIALRQEGQRVVARLRPALTAREQQVRSTFATASEARKWARGMAIAYPQLYRLIIDETNGPSDGRAA